MRAAFIGLGAMGLPMARNLAAVDGVDLVVFDISAERMRSLGTGVRLASSVEDAVRGADAVFTVLPADEHVQAVAGEVAAARAGNRWFVDFSTIGPATIEQVVRQMSAIGTRTVSVTLTRSTAAAQAGSLGLFAGGMPELPADLRPAFNAMASDVFFVGSHAAAKTFKIVNNMVVAALDILICESIVLGQLAGLSAEAVTSALAGGGVHSWVLRNHIVKYVLPDDLGPGRFSTRYMAKDVALCNLFARQQGAAAFFAGLASSYYRGSVAHGYGDDYHMRVIRWLESAAAMPRRVQADQEDVLAAMVDGAAAVQQLVSHEALELAALAGMPPAVATQCFEDGSAGNSGLDWWRSRNPGPSPSLASLADGIGRVLDWAMRLDAPATTFEVARHRALSLAVDHDLSRLLWEHK